MSSSIDLIRKIFNELTSDNLLISTKDRQNPLVSEYIIRYGDKCPPNIDNIDEDISMDRELAWYQVLTVGLV
ncbi:hypothetical protein [Vulcanisaeta distributa]|uniref:hypothetical protein n=1 Tax=Vulcanisaeta distributa TaxID=164451 RepID=UPI000A61B597|nr:hypothetical protein [Vulcanisaeta distributa]